jgi:hypothetical protein
MDKFLDAYNQQNLNQQDIKHINRLVTSNEIKEVIKLLPTKKSLMDSWPNFPKTLKKN